MSEKKSARFGGLIALWFHLRGKHGDFSLQARISHSICLVTIAVMGYNVPFSLALGLYKFAAATVVLLPLQVYLYYLSRFKGKTALSILVYCLIFYVFFAINYLSNSGLNGSGLLSFCILYFLVIAVVPRKQHLLWTVVNLLIVLGLIVWEYYDPDVVKGGYSDRSERFIDLASTYILNVIMMLACLSYIISNYDTERNATEEKAESLKQLNAQKDKLLSIVSHDFSTPLSNISRYLHILKKAEINTEIRAQLETELLRVTLDTQNLLQNLLSWSKNNMERLDSSVFPVMITDTLSDTLKIYKDMAADKKIRLDCWVGPQVTVLGNFDMIEIILRNMISNAVKFTEAHGFVTVDAREEDAFWAITVTDTGIGIAPELQSAVFRANAEPTFGTKKEKGAGLGLSLCKELAETMNGEIGFASRKGKGTEFFLRLPKTNVREK